MSGGYLPDMNDHELPSWRKRLTQLTRHASSGVIGNLAYTALSVVLAWVVGVILHSHVSIDVWLISGLIFFTLLSGLLAYRLFQSTKLRLDTQHALESSIKLVELDEMLFQLLPNIPHTPDETRLKRFLEQVLQRTVRTIGVDVSRASIFRPANDEQGKRILLQWITNEMPEASSRRTILGIDSIYHGAPEWQGLPI